jgi:cephalosporin hydroxylase
MKWFRRKSEDAPTAAPSAPANTPGSKLLTQARELLDAGKTVDALKLTQQAERTGERIPDLFFIQALCLDIVGRHDEALPIYARELEINPAHARAKESHERLSKALARPVTEKIPTEKRPWKTALAPANLHGIQQSLHNYTYRGVPMLKNPFDVALYQLLLWNLKPRTIFEIGSKSGGSGLWFGDLLKTFQIDGRVISIDIVRVDSVTHPAVTFMEGNGRELAKTLSPDFLQSLPRPWLVIEDADHSYETSKAVLEFFDPLLRKDEYIVVEDGIISDLENDPDCNSGPHRALKEFLPMHRGEYEIDGTYCDFFGYNLTWCTNGFLKKISERK